MSRVLSTIQKVWGDDDLPLPLEPAPDSLGLSRGPLGFVACHQFEFVDKLDVFEHAAPGAVFLLNAPGAPERLGTACRSKCSNNWSRRGSASSPSTPMPRQAGGHGRANQHHHADLLLRYLRGPAREEAIAQIKKAIEKSYGKRGPEVVRRNHEAVDRPSSHLHEISGAGSASAKRTRRRWSPKKLPISCKRSRR